MSVPLRFTLMTLLDVIAKKMKIRSVIFLLVGLLPFFGACQTDEIASFTTRGDGPASEFVVEALNGHGGNVDHPEEPLSLASTWRYSQDSDGIQFFLYDAEFAAVAEFLKRVLGDPDPDLGSRDYAEAIGDGNGWYSVRDKGVAASYWDKEDFVHVIVLRPMSLDQMLEHL